jgi:hypothetical protein
MTSMVLLKHGKKNDEIAVCVSKETIFEGDGSQN